MFESLKQRWHQLGSAPPGQRFQAHFQRRQQLRPRALHWKILVIGGGILIMSAGIFLMPAPGPGILIFLVGAVLVAEESLMAARLMDWADVRTRPLVAWLANRWRRLWSKDKPNSGQQ